MSKEPRRTISMVTCLAFHLIWFSSGEYAASTAFIAAFLVLFALG